MPGQAAAFEYLGNVTKRGEQADRIKRSVGVRNRGTLWIVAASATGLFACEAVLSLGSLSERTDAPNSDGAVSGDVGTSSDGASETSFVGGDASLDVSCPASWTDAGTVDPSIAAPTGSVLLHLKASGTQDYMCQNTSGASWSYVGVEGDLLNCQDQKVGTESYVTGDDVWSTTSDTSTIQGSSHATWSPNDAGGLAWELYSALNPSGTGPIAHATWIQRTNPENGEVPSVATCSSGTNGMITKVPYSADFWFYGTP
jgi:hypothetical protein